MIKWIFTDKTEKALEGKKTYDTWQQGFLQIFEHISANKRLALHVYETINREYPERYHYKMMFDLLMGSLKNRRRDTESTSKIHKKIKV